VKRRPFHNARRIDICRYEADNERKKEQQKEMNKKESSETKNAPLGDFIKSRRESRNITKADACRRSGLDYSYWVKLEAGVYQMPSPKALDLVADVIGCKPADLYVLAGYKIGGELPGFGAYLRTTTYLPPEAIDQLEGYFSFLRHQYGIPEDEPVFPPKSQDDEDEAGERSAA
jgi:transcriptional regulator with XRE-family HTH domain